MGITPFLANFGQTHPLNPQVLFFIMRHTFLWDNLSNTIHNIQADVPSQNLIAMWETLQEYGMY